MFGAVALVQIVFSFVLPSMSIRARARGLKSRLKPGFDGRPTDDQVLLLVPVLQTSLILSLALFESVSLLGFVLGFLGAPVEHFAPFFAVGFLLSLSRLPTEERLRSQVPAPDAL